MADQNTGGDFSVRWSVDVDNVKGGSTNDSDIGGGKHHQHGIDQDGDVGDWFTVSIKKPHDVVGDVNTYLAALKGNDPTWSIQPDPKHGDRVFFNVKIERDNNDQIRISWGKSGNVNRPPVVFGNKKLLTATAPKLHAKMASRKKAQGKIKTTPKKKAKKATKKKAGKKKR